jgi:WD40 repeat protein
MKRLLFPLALLSACASTGGSAVTLGDADRAAQQAIAAKVKGTIVWSSARAGNHDLYVMNPDGSDVRQITRGDNVDWFPRFSPDGSKILFCRSKKGWVYERDANSDGKWDIWTVTPDGQNETKVIDNASWGSWVSNDEIVYVRGTKIFRRKLAGGDETVVMTSEGVPELEGALLQQPELSRDGKYVAITLRGSKRETGVWDLAKKTWTKTGLGCQINWTPDGSRIYWVNPTGNGGSEVFAMPMHDGKPESPLSDEKLRFMDLPGRRSHEYFPQLSADGKWMVWAATQRGHDHDTADYEIYVWEVGTPAESAARLTFHSANDRWPDIFIPGALAARPAEKSAAPADAKSATAPESKKTAAHARSTHD